ncbi:ADP/ATP carrier protein, partial [Coemansia sp. RSA 2322]
MSQTTDVGSLAPLGHAISGAGSSALALLLIYPLDTIKTRQQVQTRAGDSAGLDSAVRKIIREEGVGGLYAGVASNVVNQAVNGFVYFYAYSMVRRMAQRAAGGEGLSTAVELAVGALAGMVNQVITLPMGVVATRQQTAHAAERRRTWVQTVRGIVRDEGVGGL